MANSIRGNSRLRLSELICHLPLSMKRKCHSLHHLLLQDAREEWYCSHKHIFFALFPQRPPEFLMILFWKKEAKLKEENNFYSGRNKNPARGFHFPINEEKIKEKGKKGNIIHFNCVGCGLPLRLTITPCHLLPPSSWPFTSLLKRLWPFSRFLSLLLCPEKMFARPSDRVSEGGYNGDPNGSLLSAFTQIDIIYYIR